MEKKSCTTWDAPKTNMRGHPKQDFFHQQFGDSTRQTHTKQTPFTSGVKNWKNWMCFLGTWRIMSDCKLLVTIICFRPLSRVSLVADGL